MNISNNLIENNISEEIDNTKQDMMETEVCVSIKDATFAWPNSKIPVLAVDNLKIEEGKSSLLYSYIEDIFILFYCAQVN